MFRLHLNAAPCIWICGVSAWSEGADSPQILLWRPPGLVSCFSSCRWLRLIESKPGEVKHLCACSPRRSSANMTAARWEGGAEARALCACVVTVLLCWVVSGAPPYLHGSEGGCVWCHQGKRWIQFHFNKNVKTYKVFKTFFFFFQFCRILWQKRSI